MRRLAIIVMILLASLARSQTSDSRLLKARTVAVIASVEYLRADRAKYDNKTEVNRILAMVDSAGLFKTPTFPHAPYRATDSDKADLLITFEESVALPQTVAILVRDPDTNEELYREKRDTVELRNDIRRLVSHFLAYVEEKKAEAERAEENAREQERKARAAAEAARAKQQCIEEEAAFRQNIISLVVIQHQSLPPMTEDIMEHNRRCRDSIVVPEEIVNHYRAEAAAKEAAERARAEQVRRDEERKKVLSSFQQEVAAAAFVAPTAGQMQLSYQLPIPMGTYYIVPSDGKPDACTFPPQEVRKLKGAKAAMSLGVLNCPRTGREDFLVLRANDRFYLIEAIKFVSESERVGTVKDNGTTVCFHDGGCRHVLAEVRLVPTDLPHSVHIPPPGPLTETYDSDGFSIRYPQNWRVSRKPGSNFIEIVPPEGHVGTWYTHGIFAIHFAPTASFPSTLAGAFGRVVAVYEKGGRTFESNPTSKIVGRHEGLMQGYTTSSPVSGEEAGRMILVQDGSGGYYEFWSFTPVDEAQVYRAVFESILDTAQFDATLYVTDMYSGTVHNQTVDKSAKFEVSMRYNEGNLSGCSGIVKPLYGSGPLKGVIKNGAVTFTVNGNGFDLLFRGKSENGKITGTYTVSPINNGAGAQQGDFRLEKMDSKRLLIQPCPTDAEMNANSQ
jgi:hypothetical protein